MIYGYIRVSTKTQANDGNSIDSQMQVLKAAGVEKYYIDTMTGVKMERPQLNSLLEELVEGDTIVVTKIDRFARTISQATETIDGLIDKGVKVHILNLGILDNSSTSVLIRNVMLAFSQFEHDMILERTMAGKEIAKLKPGYKEGRPKKFKPEQIELAMELLKTNSYKKVSLMTGISESTLVREKRKQ